MPDTENVLDESFDADRFPREQIERDVTTRPGEIRVGPYDINAEQDKVRGRLAQGLFLLLSITVLATLGLLGADHIDGQAAGIVLSPSAGGHRLRLLLWWKRRWEAAPPLIKVLSAHDGRIKVKSFGSFCRSSNHPSHRPSRKTAPAHEATQAFL